MAQFAQGIAHQKCLDNRCMMVGGTPHYANGALLPSQKLCALDVFVLKLQGQCKGAKDSCEDDACLEGFRQAGEAKPRRVRPFFIFAKLCGLGVFAFNSPFGIRNTLDARVGIYGFPPTSSSSSSAFCECRRFSASSHTTLCGPSMTSAATSSPRCAGRQCMKIASGLAAAMTSAVTW